MRGEHQRGDRGQHGRQALGAGGLLQTSPGTQLLRHTRGAPDTLETRRQGTGDKEQPWGRQVAWFDIPLLLIYVF